jgi:hypothetical protein
MLILILHLNSSLNSSLNMLSDPIALRVSFFVHLGFSLWHPLVPCRLGGPSTLLPYLGYDPQVGQLGLDWIQFEPILNRHKGRPFARSQGSLGPVVSAGCVRAGSYLEPSPPACSGCSQTTSSIVTSSIVTSVAMSLLLTLTTERRRVLIPPRHGC